MKKLLGLMLLLLLLTACIGGNDPVTSDGPETPPIQEDSNAIGATQVVDGIEFSKMVLKLEGETTTVTFTVRNTKSEAVFLSILGYEFFNEDEAFIFSTQVGGQELAAGESWEYSNEIGVDITHAATVKFEVTLEPVQAATLPVEE